MRSSGFRKQSIDEVRAKQAVKRAKLTSKGFKPKKAGKVGKKEKTQAQLKKELDRVFSIYVRQKYADENGNVACYTCGKVMHWKQIQAGHFVSRQYLATRWNEDNVKPQCVGDNIFGNGKPLDFEEHLKEELGEEYVEEMKKSRHQVLKLDRHWYAEQIERYKKLLTPPTGKE